MDHKFIGNFSLARKFSFFTGLWIKKLRETTQTTSILSISRPNSEKNGSPFQQFPSKKAKRQNVWHLITSQKKRTRRKAIKIIKKKKVPVTLRPISHLVIKYKYKDLSSTRFPPFSSCNICPKPFGDKISFYCFLVYPMTESLADDRASQSKKKTGPKNSRQ